MNKEYVVRLSQGERAELEAMVKRGHVKATVIRRAHILLKADADGPGWSDAEIAEAFGCSPHTVENVRRRFVDRGMDGTLRRKRQDRPSRRPILDGQGEARLIALACSEPPEGRARWTLRLLADRAVELEIAEGLSYETARRMLKKTS